ncbi:MAG: hypothetical protein ACK5N0_01185 [Synechococcaceae cyanobacterium]
MTHGSGAPERNGPSAMGPAVAGDVGTLRRGEQAAAAAGDAQGPRPAPRQAGTGWR